MILLTGGSGLLGRELRKHIKCLAPSRDFIDISRNNYEGYENNEKGKFLLWYLDEFSPKLIIHCAAYTDVLKAETEKQLCYDTNVIGTRNIASLGIPMIYISTEYVFDGKKGEYNELEYPNPQNFYAFTKLLGEYESKRSPRSCVIRCLFKPRPFEHEAACVDQWTSGDYVDVMAKEISLAVSCFDKLPATLHIGTERKSTYELAQKTKPVRAITRGDIGGVILPRDTSLDCSLWRKIKSENRIC